MGPIEIIVNDDQIRKDLGELERRTGNLRPALVNIGEYLVRSTWERFNEQKDPQGRPWAPLKASTAARKRGAKILIETSRLRDSIAYDAGEDYVAVGTNVKYAAIHQLGGTTSPHLIRPYRKRALYWPGAKHPVSSVNHPGSRIPARPFLGVSDEDRSEILDIISDHAMRGRR